ncbi:MAG: type 2 isopentenyl-diphosphate Delta-isomerase [Holosporaceae bacterium]|jgi:isopentenyl-diphosphate delta-isomerase|nr:type 2 isopentenyl-diphosphate Delta-isomerase [Holosporaceae bacterium]
MPKWPKELKRKALGMQNKISNRKDEHLSIVLAEQVSDDRSGSSFDNYTFVHNALPEIDFANVDTSLKFLGRKMNLPIMISPITGGSERSKKINRALSELANDFKIGFAVGSQRGALTDKDLEVTYKIRQYAPDILVFANFGAVQLNYGFSLDECRRAIDMIDADALVLHLNPLHEIFQMEGNTNFSGLLKKIEHICAKLDAPVVIKEVGYGISAELAKKLADVGVYAVDIAGSGSISWGDVEGKKSNDIVKNSVSKVFAHWGNSTAQCLEEIAKNVKNIKIIASGGIKNGIDMAKSIAMGAEFCGNASEFLRRVVLSRSESEIFVESLALELKAAMFCLGCKNIAELRHVDMRKNGQY